MFKQLQVFLVLWGNFFFFCFQFFWMRQISGFPSSSEVGSCTVSSCQSESFRSLIVTTSGLLQVPICCDALAMLTNSLSPEDSSPVSSDMLMYVGPSTMTRTGLSALVYWHTAWAMLMSGSSSVPLKSHIFCKTVIADLLKLPLKLCLTYVFNLAKKKKKYLPEVEIPTHKF